MELGASLGSTVRPYFKKSQKHTQNPHGYLCSASALDVFGTPGDSSVSASILEIRRPGVHNLPHCIYVGSGDLNVGFHLPTATVLPTEHPPSLHA